MSDSFNYHVISRTHSFKLIAKLMITLRVASPLTAHNQAWDIRAAASIKLTVINLRRPKLIGSFEKSRGWNNKSRSNDKVRQRCGFVAQIGPRSVDLFVLWMVKSLESQSWSLKINQTFVRKYERMIEQRSYKQLVVVILFWCEEKKRQEKYFIYKTASTGGLWALRVHVGIHR